MQLPMFALPVTPRLRGKNAWAGPQWGESKTLPEGRDNRGYQPGEPAKSQDPQVAGGTEVARFTGSGESTKLISIPMNRGKSDEWAEDRERKALGP